MEKIIPVNIEKVAQNEMNRAVRIKYPLSIAIMEIDQLTEFSQNYGKETCDKLLSAFKLICQKNSREIDTVFNLSNNLFILFLPGAGNEHAYVAAERIRLVASKGIPISSELVIPLKISIGISTFQDNQVAIDTLVTQALQALTHAKNNESSHVVGFEDI